jgi:hypothetical protein
VENPKPEVVDNGICSDKRLKPEKEMPDFSVEIEACELEVVSGGGDGTAVGVGKY